MANINVYIQQAIQGIETERDQRIEEVKTRVMLEVASPNAEIDSKRDKAIDELQAKLNQDIAALQERFNKERQDIINASEKQKTDNTNARIAAETASISAEYNLKLAGLRKLIEA